LSGLEMCPEKGSWLIARGPERTGEGSVKSIS
jgi:hypothetical protein